MKVLKFEMRNFRNPLFGTGGPGGSPNDLASGSTTSNNSSHSSKHPATGTGETQRRILRKHKHSRDCDSASKQISTILSSMPTLERRYSNFGVSHRNNKSVPRRTRIGC
jgi:hypothetical protein